MIYVIATIDVLDSKADEFLKLAEPCIAATRNEDGCDSYVLHRATDDESRFVFVERWRDRDALDAHFAQPHLVDFRNGGAPMIKAKTVEIIDPAHVDIL
ncbi:MAG: putative quinol monooxygenase [Pseudomonadota bacterium]